MDDFSTLTAEELSTRLTEMRSAFQALVTAANPTPEQVEEARGLAAQIEAALAVEAARASAPADMAALAAQVEATTSDPTPDPAPAGDPTPNPEPTGNPDPEPNPDDEDPPADPEPAPPSGPASDEPQASTSRVAELAAKTARPVVPATSRSRATMAIIASADVPDYAAGHQFVDMLEVAKAVMNRAHGFPVPDGDGKREDIRKFGTAKFSLDYPDELTITRRDSEDSMSEKINYACDWRNIPEHGALTAAGWCAPSETDYSVDDDATDEGILSLPELLIRRGGLKWVTNPTFADFYANPGFIQTETQAIANTVKPCVTITCPPFSEARLDVEGLCIKVPILTEAAYPEVVKQFVSGTMTAHKHWINANIIGRLVTAAGAARVFAGLGSSVDDSLEAFLIAADQRRQKYRLSFNHPMEVLLPFWVKNMHKADLRRRNGRSTPVSDAELNAEYSNAKLNVQFLYDWTVFDETAEVYPATYPALIYPAGTFFKGTAPVITLNTVYDAASLAVNTYTGLFTEQGFLVGSRKFGADLLTLPTCNAGRRGSLNMVCS